MVIGRKMMKRIPVTVLALLVVAGIVVSVVWAQNVHNKKGPTCTDNLLTATCTGTLAGLGNYDILVKLTTTGVGDTTCTSPGGNTKVPGQNPGITIPNITGIQVIPAPSVKNGNAPYTVFTQEPPPPTADQAGCPNSNWTAAFSDISFTGISATGNATLSIFQCIGGTYSTQGICSAGGTNGSDGTLVLTDTLTK
jgi:hypothetical protein